MDIRNNNIEVSSKTSYQSRLKGWLKNNILLVATLIAVFLGVMLGLLLRIAKPNDDVILLVEMPGNLFLRILKMLVLPIMIASIVTGHATLNGKAEGKLAGLTSVYFILTSLVSALIGLVFVTSIHPGTSAISSSVEASGKTIGSNARLLDTFLDLLRNAFPENLVEACVQQVYTTYTENPVDGLNTTKLEKVLSVRPGTNSLGLIIFCLAFGGTLGGLGKKAQVMKDFFSSLDQIVMRLVLKVMWITPVGVLSLISAKLVAVSDIYTLLQQVTLFVATLVGGLTTELLLFEPLVFFLVTRENPYTFLLKLLEALITASATCSSAAAMPLTLRCLEDKCYIDRRVTRFVVPIGVTVNMNGTALFVTTATFFIAQMNSIKLGVGDYFAVVVTATAVSIAATSVPSAAVFLMVMCLNAIGAPLNDVSLIFAMEWINDRCRTVNNAMGDAYACAVVAHFCRKELELSPENTTEMEKYLSEIPISTNNDHIRNIIP
ncbi:excitatory amino acid transporter 2-like [Tachypleus tridentatus]|uniref:excitatory amino acid transporter 2-like n=1 Tax=Tachypleus tridentatus TaxID=6853 RepID=UPI003FD628FA